MTKKQIARTVIEIKDSIRNRLGRRAFRHLKSFDELVEMQDSIMNQHPKWEKLPDWAKHEVTGYWEALLESLEDQLVFTVVVDGIRASANHPRFEGQYRKGMDNPPVGSDMAYAVKAKDASLATFTFIPFNQSERDRDVAEGRLTAQVIELAKYPELPGAERYELIAPTENFTGVPVLV
jgi:hypothetical protein